MYPWHWHKHTWNISCFRLFAVKMCLVMAINESLSLSSFFSLIMLTASSLNIPLTNISIHSANILIDWQNTFIKDVAPPCDQVWIWWMAGLGWHPCHCPQQGGYLQDHHRYHHRRPHCHHHHHYHSHQHQHHHYHHIGTNYLTATVKLISSLNNCTNQVSFEEFKLQFSAMYEQVISFLKLTLELRKIISRLSVREEKSWHANWSCREEAKANLHNIWY